MPSYRLNDKQVAHFVQERWVFLKGSMKKVVSELKMIARQLDIEPDELDMALIHSDPPETLLFDQRVWGLQ
jgi:hypothetical protein